jgi:eukaryotic-like serine/threonine-protein kinase
MGRVDRTGDPARARAGSVGDLLRMLGIAFLAVLTGVMIFDRILMPRVVRHGSEVRVPSVAGRDLSEAESIVRSSGLQPVRMPGRHHPDVARGEVLEVAPSIGLDVKRGRQIFLTPSLGPVNRRMPDITGITARMARVELSVIGLRIVRTDYAATDLVAPDQILAASPEPGAAAPENGAVAVLVSRARAPAPYWLPDLRGLRASESTYILQGCGLQASISTSEGQTSGPPGTVVEQDPPPGTPVWPGTRITLSISRGLAPQEGRG